MNCESVVERIRALAEGALHGEEKGACMNHVATCQDCADALRGVRAMLVIRDQAAVPGSERVFSRVMSRAGYDPHREASRRGFWLGAGFGGAIAASLLAAEEAYAKGYTQVLWLDACDKKSIEEVGTSNIFFKFEDELVTPPLTGSILPGITRDTVLTLARDRGLTVNQRRITIDEVIAGCQDGSLQESFATGTAAVISPVGEINHQGRTSIVGDGQVGELSRSLYDEILDIQYGRRPDPHGWVVKL